jgi:hypothetical protein
MIKRELKVQEAERALLLTQPLGKPGLCQLLPQFFHAVDYVLAVLA